MAAIENDRDIILQATSPRVVPVKIPIDQVEGLSQALKSLRINSSATTFIGGTTTTPSTITLTAQKLGGLEGVVVWTVISGSATITPTGDVAVVQGSSVTGSSVSIQARVTVDGTNYDAQITLSKLGSLASEDQVDLTTQVTGQLASGNVSGLGALALLNKVDLNTQTTGALNGQTRVTNLGSLAYANSIAANQIGAGTLAAGVIYAGTIKAENINAGSFSGKDFTGGSFTGSVFRTNTKNVFPRIEINGGSSSDMRVYNQLMEMSLEIVGNGIRAKSYNFGEALLITAGTSNASSANGISVAVPGYGVQIDSPSAPIYIAPKSSFPSRQPSRGSLFMHTAHGLCISDGTRWLKTTWTPV